MCRGVLRLPLANARSDPLKPTVSKDKRPVNLDLGSMQLPITAYVSITHRLSGVFLFLVSGLMVWALDTSLR